MKRFHVNVSVTDISAGIRFYTALFAAEPTVREDDYAKWMLEDPRINFAISQRGFAPGVNHLGLQVDTAEELAAMRSQLSTADQSLVEEIDAACCYAKSDKYWVTDPVGIPWETFHTLESIPIYGVDTEVAPKHSTCCLPATPVGAGTGGEAQAAASISCCPD
jgi:lactoylglutathione lyase